jgi:predicted DNA binding CopG/RHH family protein
MTPPNKTMQRTTLRVAADRQVVSLPNLKPSTAAISLRLPASMLDDLKVLANKHDVPYQSLLKVFLVECIERELRKER